MTLRGLQLGTFDTEPQAVTAIQALTSRPPISLEASRRYPWSEALSAHQFQSADVQHLDRSLDPCRRASVGAPSRL